MIDPTYTQMVLQLPPDAAVNNPAFVHDYFNTFTTTMFLGCEVGRQVLVLVRAEQAAGKRVYKLATRRALPALPTDQPQPAHSRHVSP